MGEDEWRCHVLGANILIPAAISRIDYDHMIDAKLMDNIPNNVMHNNRAKETRNEIEEHFTKLIAGYRHSGVVTQIDIAWIGYRHLIHVGAHLSVQSGIMRSLTPFCFTGLEIFELSINHQWRIKNDFRFVRNLMEKKNPRVANTRTGNGTPAITNRLTNLYRFNSLRIYMADLMLEKVSKKLLSKRLSLRVPDRSPAYPLPTWKGAWLRWAAAENMLIADKMHSGSLYNPLELVELVEQDLAGSYPNGEFLNRVITMEMALRAASTSIEL